MQIISTEIHYLLVGLLHSHFDTLNPKTDHNPQNIRYGFPKHVYGLRVPII